MFTLVEGVLQREIEDAGRGGGGGEEIVIKRNILSLVWTSFHFL